jgi:hypothetical protein
MIAGIGAEGCFLIAFSLSIELVGVKATLFFFSILAQLFLLCKLSGHMVYLQSYEYTVTVRLRAVRYTFLLSNTDLLFFGPKMLPYTVTINMCRRHKNIVHRAPRVHIKIFL